MFLAGFHVTHPLSLSVVSFHINDAFSEGSEGVTSNFCAKFFLNLDMEEAQEPIHD